MWRKNREPFGGAIGNDPNRNYAGCSGDLEGDWGAVDEYQAAHNPSHGWFCGAYANSGDETRAMTMYVKSHTINAYMSYHSYGELLMWPWGWSNQAVPDATIYSQVGNHMANMIQRLEGGTYDCGPMYTTIYPVSGGSVDWAYSWSLWVGGRSNLSFTTELGTTGYQPASDLDIICRENFDALKYLAGFCDSIVLVCEGVVPPPDIYPLDIVLPDFTIAWHASNTADNHPIEWELVELSEPSVVEDDLESGASRWILDGFTLSTNQAHSGSYSLFSGYTNDMNSAVRTAHPYLVEMGDSLSFWCWYVLENNYDVAIVEVSENTKEWFCLDDRYSGNSGGWVRKSYSLENWIGKSLYFRFRMMTDYSVTYPGLYVDDISPAVIFQTIDTLSSSIPDTLYQSTSHALGEYYYYVRGNNAAWGWGDYSCLEKVNVATGLAEQPVTKRIGVCHDLIATILRGPLKLPADNTYRVFDITGRVVEPTNIAPGIYFVEIGSKIVQKVVKIR